MVVEPSLINNDETLATIADQIVFECIFDLLFVKILLTLSSEMSRDFTKSIPVNQ